VQLVIFTSDVVARKVQPTTCVFLSHLVPTKKNTSPGKSQFTATLHEQISGFFALGFQKGFAPHHRPL
jgi:hypothetical protein